MRKSTIFDIQHFCIHDGDGIRTTVFFKGCPLNCIWCHNPESISRSFDMLYNIEKCTSCGECVKRCTTKAITMDAGGRGVVTDMSRCSFEGKCVFFCINSAREIVGMKRSVAEVVAEVEKDIIFYQESNGGVTLSGGEPLLQIDFVEELVIELKKLGIHISIDTCGYVPFKNFERVAKYVDTFLYDLKAIDNSTHKIFTAVENVLILENLNKLAAIHNDIHIRMPIIEGVNATDEHINGALELMIKLNIKRVSLLPYHDIAKHKHTKLGLVYQNERMAIPSKSYMDKCHETYTKNGLDVTIGG